MENAISSQPRTALTLTETAKRLIVLTSIALLFSTRPLETVRSARAQAPPRQDANVSATKTANYVGLTKCATCHFDQYKDWKTSPHGKAFDILPAKYKQDAECLKCHTTGYGHASGYRNNASNVGLAGISCEACHGPGDEHANNALRLVEEGITEEGLKRVRTSIQRTDLNQCIACHISKAHKPHPPFDRDESVRPTADAIPPRAKSFFSFSAHEKQRQP